MSKSGLWEWNLQKAGRLFGIIGIALLLGPSDARARQGLPPNQATPSSNSSNVPAYGRSPRGNDSLEGPMTQPNPMRLQHLREEERHKRLQADMEKLVSLTNELKAQVDKATKDELSLDVVRKAAEIEKLAHDVKERMKS